MHAYSLDLRKRIVDAVNAGQSHQEVAKRFSLSRASVSRYVQLSKVRPSLAPKPLPGAKRRIPEIVMASLVERIAARPDTTLVEHQSWLLEQHHLTISLATVHRALCRSGFTYKKSRWLPPNETKTNGLPGVTV